jgi:hypothetical protein
MAKKPRMVVSHDGKEFDEEREVEIEIYQKVFLGLISKENVEIEPEDIKSMAASICESLSECLENICDNSDAEDEAWEVFFECYMLCIPPIVSQLKMADLKNEATLKDTVSEYAIAMFSGIVQEFFEDDEEGEELN